MRKAISFFVLVPLVLVAAACSGGGGGGSSSSSAGGAPEPVPPVKQRALPAQTSVGGESKASLAADHGGAAAVPDIGPKIVQTASVELSVRRGRFDETVDDVRTLVAGFGGFVASSSVTSSSGGDLQLRVPSSRLDLTIQRLSKLAKVRGLSRNTRDITVAVVSARDRLNDARAERKSLLRQLANATTINETKSLRARLRIVSREIAAARNALARVNNRANFSNVSVTLVTTRGSSGGGVWTPSDAFHDALRVLEVIAGVLLIAAAVALPLLLAWLLGWLARRGVTRRRRERALDMA
jgi:hypothetical protein